MASCATCYSYIDNPPKPSFEKDGLLQTVCLPIFDGVYTDICIDPLGKRASAHRRKERASALFFCAAYSAIPKRNSVELVATNR